MPDNVAAALALFITACATALLQYSTSHWAKQNDDAKESKRRRRRRSLEAEPEED